MPIVARRGSDLRDIESVHCSKCRRYLRLAKESHSHSEFGAACDSPTHIAVTSRAAPKELFAFDGVFESHVNNAALYAQTCHATCRTFGFGASCRVIVTGNESPEQRNEIFSGAKESPGIVYRILKSLARQVDATPTVTGYDSMNGVFVVDKTAFVQAFPNDFSIQSDAALVKNMLFAVYCADPASGALFDLLAECAVSSVAALRLDPIVEFHHVATRLKSALRRAPPGHEAHVRFACARLDQRAVRAIHEHFQSKIGNEFRLSPSQIGFLDVANVGLKSFKRMHPDLENTVVIASVDPNVKSLVKLTKLLSLLSGKESILSKIDQNYVQHHQHHESTSNNETDAKHEFAEHPFPAACHPKDSPREPIEPRALCEAKLHAAISDVSSQLPSAAEMTAWTPFEPEALESFRDAVRAKAKSVRAIAAHWLHGKNIMREDLAANHANTEAARAHVASLESEIAALRSAKLLAERQLSQTCAESLKLKSEYGRLDAVHRKKTSAKVDAVRDELQSAFGSKRAAYKSALSSQHEKIALVRELAKSETPTDLERRIENRRASGGAGKENKRPSRDLKFGSP